MTANGSTTTHSHSSIIFAEVLHVTMRPPQFLDINRGLGDLAGYLDLRATESGAPHDIVELMLARKVHVLDSVRAQNRGALKALDLLQTQIINHLRSDRTNWTPDGLKRLLHAMEMTTAVWDSQDVTAGEFFASLLVKNGQDGVLSKLLMANHGHFLHYLSAVHGSFTAIATRPTDSGAIVLQPR